MKGKNMLNAEIKARAERQIATITASYRHSKAGYRPEAMALPYYETQEDFNLYRPEDAGNDFREENEFVSEILKGLRANGVPAEMVTIRHVNYSKWLNGRKNTTDTRAQYCGFLVSEMHRDSA